MVLKNTPKKKREQIVLAIYPNSKGFGFAVMTSALHVLNAQMIPIRPSVIHIP